MAEVKVDRGQARKSYKSPHEQPFNLQLDVSTLNVMCRFVISDSSYVRRYDLAQLRKFIQLISDSMMETYNEEIRDRVLFIKIALASRLDNRLTSTDAIFGYISSNFPKDINFISRNDSIGREDINWVNQVVSETLKYAFIYRAIPNIRELCNEFTQTELGHRGNIVGRIEDSINSLHNDFRAARIQDDSNTTFSLMGEMFENQMTDTYAAVRSPSRRLMTGMTGLNLMTGGFENGRVYMLIGDSGIGKSFTLLNIILQVKRYNTQYKTKDPTKTPCIVLLTMENTMIETLTRLFALVNEENIPMRKYNSLTEVIKIMREQGGLQVTEGSPIDIVVKYKPNHSVSTDYLYDLYDELGDMGKEPIMLVQDHVKRIRSVESVTELRVELGNIVNEFKNFAADKDIPVLTDAHVNRAASLMLDRGANKGDADVTKRVGKGDTGESMMMIENLDMGIIVNKVFYENQWWMVFKSVKMRDDQNLSYFAQPLASKIRLIEDVNLPKPLYKETLETQSDLYGNMMQSVGPGVKMIPGTVITSSIPSDLDEEFMEKQNIGVPDVNEMENLVNHEGEDMWARAKRLGKICPFNRVVPEDNAEDIAQSIIEDLMG